MNSPTFTIVRTARTVVDADMLIGILRSAGLHPVDLDTSSHVFLAGADVSYHIEVPASEADQARALLNSFQRLGDNV